MYKCSKCGKDIAAPKDITVQSVQCRCGNMVSFTDAPTMVPLPPPTQKATRNDSDEIMIFGYQIVKKIGEGGMGCVFEAIQESLRRKVAIKVLPKRLAADPQFIRRFEREAGALSQLRHPNIGGIIDRGTAGGTYYFIMEYVANHDGNVVSMHDLISGGKLNNDTILKFTREIASALAYAHSKGIVHRDIKPSNVLIDEHGAARVVDFGIAQILGGDNQPIHLTMTGAAIGTPQYMSPEQRTDISKSDARSDIYSLGVLVYVMLTGELPEGKWELPSELGCNPMWDAVIETAIRKLPERRFQTMTDFITALNTVSYGSSIPKNPIPAANIKNNEQYRTPIPSSFTLGKCPGCSSENPGDNRFCNCCGSSLYEICPNCKVEIRVGLRFCGKCGADIPKIKQINELQIAIETALKDAAEIQDNITAATKLILSAVELEETMVKISTNPNTQPLTARAALNNLWNTSTLNTDIFPNSGEKQLQLLNQVGGKLPERKDIQSKIHELSTARDNLILELKNIFSAGYFLQMIEIATKSRWSDSSEIAKIIADAQTRLTKAIDFIDAQIPTLIDQKRYYELNQVIAQLKELGTAMDGIIELQNKTNTTIEHAKQLYDAATLDITDHKFQESKSTLEKLLLLCSDYPNANDLLNKVNNIITQQIENLEQAKKYLAAKEYKKAINLLQPLTTTSNDETVKSLYATAVSGEALLRRRKQRRTVTAVLAVIFIFIISIAINKYAIYREFNSYCTEGNLAMTNKNYVQAINAFEKALNVRGYNDNNDTKELLKNAQLEQENKLKFDKLMADGYHSLERNKWADAENSFNEAKKISGYECNREVIANLKKCDINKNEPTFNKTFNEGAKALAEKDYEKAVTSFEAALSIPGFENNKNAALQREQSKVLLEQKKEFEQWMLKGNTLLERNEWTDAENAFKNALAVPGYANNNSATTSQKSAEFQCQQSESEYNKIYTEASSHYQQSRTLYNDGPGSYKKCKTALKIIADFTASTHYRNISGVNKQRLTELTNQADEYIKNIWLGPSQGQPWTVPSLNMQFVYVAPGTFQMGANDGESSEKPIHSVTISKGYWIGKYEVTQDEYLAITRERPSYFKGGKKPVEQVRWDDAVSFCQKLTERERAAGRLPFGYEYCLPTEAQWEFAARGGTASKGFKYSGGNTLDNLAWYDSNSGSTTHDVGTKSSNELGIHDMSGNVWEWCQDDWHDSYNGAPSDDSRWCNGTGSDRVARVARGGSWDYYASYCRVAKRFCNSFGHMSDRRGFRVALAPVSTSNDTKPTTSVTSSITQEQSVVVPSLEMPFVYVEPGTFQMGSSDGESDEKPVHAVTISKGYWIGKCEVTQDEYLAITGSSPSNFKGGKKPVEQVRWDDAVSFCQKLTERERAAGRLPFGYEYRLPTEAEWEFAARGGTASKGYKYSGSDNLDSVVWYNNNSSGVTHEVGTKSSNELGIYDMSGNVWEWCQDDWHGNYDGAPSDGNKWGDGTGSHRVAHGGSWFSRAAPCRVAARCCLSPDYGDNSIGFRVVRASSSK